MRTYEYSKLGLENLALVERPMPRPAAREVVVKFHAASLNYRDRSTGLLKKGLPCSSNRQMSLIRLMEVSF